MQSAMTLKQMMGLFLPAVGLGAKNCHFGAWWRQSCQSLFRDLLISLQEPLSPTGSLLVVSLLLFLSLFLLSLSLTVNLTGEPGLSLRVLTLLCSYITMFSSPQGLVVVVALRPSSLSSSFVLRPSSFLLLLVLVLGPWPSSLS